MSDDDDDERRRRGEIMRTAAGSAQLSCEERAFLTTQADLLDQGESQGPIERWRTGHLVWRVLGA